MAAFIEIWQANHYKEPYIQKAHFILKKHNLFKWSLPIEFLENIIGNIEFFWVEIKEEYRNFWVEIWEEYRKFSIFGSKYWKNIGSLVRKIQEKSHDMEIFCEFYIIQNSLIVQSLLIPHISTCLQFEILWIPTIVHISSQPT